MLSCDRQGLRTVTARPCQLPDVSFGFHLGPGFADVDRRSQLAASVVVGAAAGIVSECQTLDAPGLPGLAIRVARGPRRVPGWSLPEPIDGTGVATSAAAAERAAIGEVVESYCAYAPVADEDLVRASARQLGSSAVAPERFAWPSPRQYAQLSPLRPLSPDRVIHWCPAWSLSKRRAVLVPSALVHSERARQPPDDFLPEVTSTGLAAHPWVPAAALSALCEVLERDALAIAWYSELPLTPLRTQGSDLDRLVAGLGEQGLAVDLFSVPSEGPFSVLLAVARPADGPPWAAVGAACRPSPVAAAHKAVAESAQVLLRLQAGGGGPPGHDAAAHYATADGKRELMRCLGSTHPALALEFVPSVTTGDVGRDLAKAVEALGQQGLEVVLADVTTADVADAGWRVLRALVPGTLSIGTHPRFAPLGAERLYQVPVRLGLHQAPLDEDQLRPLPVPLA